MANSTAFGMKYWTGVNDRRRQHDEAEEPEGLGRVAPVEPVVVPARRTGA